MSTLMPPGLKQALYAACERLIQDRIAVTEAAMRAAQESANSETKSSAGDKYETGRAMAQNERDRHAVQLHETRRLLAELGRIDPTVPCDTVRPGALVTTSLGRFFVATSAGKLSVAGEEEWVAMSAAAPLATALAGHRAGDEVVFNGRPVRVLAVA